LRSDRSGLSQGVYVHFHKNQKSLTFVLCNFRAEFEHLRNKDYVIRILNFLCILWSLFGSIWSRPDEVIGETNSVMQHIWLTLTGQIRRNGKKPVFVVVCVPFSYLDKYFHDFRIFAQTLVNISKQVPNSDPCFLNCEMRQIETNTSFGYVMNLHKFYVHKYFQNFS
jgi:hypothetical protein